MKILQLLEGASFGLMDGIILCLGIVIGVAAATSSATTVIVAGIIGGVSDAFGNSIGFYVSQLAEKGVQTHETRNKTAKHKIHTHEEVILSGIASFLMTVLAFVVLLGPFFFLSINDAMILSFAMAIVSLALLGVYVARLSKENVWETSAWYAGLGIAGALISYWVGLQLKIVFGL